VYNNDRISSNGNAKDGSVRLSASKLAWVGGNFLVAIIGGYYTFSWQVFTLFLSFTAITLCLGHSLGMHRHFIHQSYDCPKWMEYLFVHFGVLVGLAGPYGMIRTHDIRDWAQRQADCHSYFRHGEQKRKDAYWQLLCNIKLEHPPTITIDDEYWHDPVYQWMERYWMWQQLPWALLFLAIGGVDWVIWGVAARTSISIFGHWFIGYFAHNQGHKSWHVEGAAVQGHNIRFTGWVTMGECWHNNHHAFPGSALLGIEKGQSDPGWWVLMALQKVGLVWNIKTHLDLPDRPELVQLLEGSLNEAH